MKLNIRTLLPAFVCGVIITTSCALLAEDAAPATSGTTTSGTTAPPPHGGKGDRHHGGGGEAMIEHTLGKLNLTPDQQAKIKPIMDDLQAKMKALQSDTSVPDDQKKAKGKDLHKDAMQQIKQFLTADQIEQLGDHGHHKDKKGAQPSASPSPSQSGTNTAH